MARHSLQRAALVLGMAALLVTANGGQARSSKGGLGSGAAARPVMVAHDGEELDACSSTGVVKPLRPGGDGFVSVRAAPGVAAPEKDRIRPGTELFICDNAQGGKWLGVVYRGKGQGKLDCGVSSPRPGPVAYRGPCRSGWVADRLVKFIVG